MVTRTFFAALLLAISGGLLAHFNNAEHTDSPLWLTLVSDEADIEPAAPKSYDRSKVHATGVVEGQSQATELRFEVHGRITHLGCSDERAKPQFVRKGDILARVDHTCSLESLRECEAMLAKAKADKAELIAGASDAELDEARANVKATAARVVASFHVHRRRKVLVEQAAVSDQELDDAAAAYNAAHARWLAAKAKLAQLEEPPRDFEVQAADAEIALARSRVEQAKATLHKSLLRAPCDGVVLRVEGEVGELTGPEAAAPVVTLVDATTLRVRAYVDELDALDVQPGQAAEVMVDSLPDVRLQGRIEACLASMQPKTHLRHTPTEQLDVKVREVVIELDVEPRYRDQLVYGLPVDVTVLTNEVASAPSTPVHAEVLHASHEASPVAARLAATP